MTGLRFKGAIPTAQSWVLMMGPTQRPGPVASCADTSLPWKATASLLCSLPMTHNDGYSGPSAFFFKPCTSSVIPLTAGVLASYPTKSTPLSAPAPPLSASTTVAESRCPDPRPMLYLFSESHPLIFSRTSLLHYPLSPAASKFSFYSIFPISTPIQPLIFKKKKKMYPSIPHSSVVSNQFLGSLIS